MRMIISLLRSASLATLMIMLSSSVVLGVSVKEMRAKWEGVSNGIDEINAEVAVEKGSANNIPVESNKESPEVEVQPVTDPNAPPLTSTLVAWISSQSENIVQEMEAIANQNAQSSKFSVVNYLRYLKLHDSLQVIARQPIDELRWVNRKAKVFRKVYRSATEVVLDYLDDLELSLKKIEKAEPKGKAQEVSKKWVELYESMRYIATHAPTGSDIAKTATSYLKKSPDNSPDRMRATRYQLKTHAFNR